MPSGVPRSHLAVEMAPPSEGPPPPEPGFLETVAAGFRTTYDEVPDVQENRLDRAYHPVVQALRDMGQEDDFGRPWYGAASLTGGIFGSNSIFDPDKVWAGIEAARERDPKAFAELGDRETFERNVLTRAGERASDQNVLARGSGIAGFIGAMGGEFRDPVNLASLPIGGAGKTVAARMLSEGLINAGIETVQVPLRMGSRERLGEELTAEEAVLNIAAAGAGGAVLRGAFELTPRAASKIAETVTANIDRLPAPLAERWAVHVTRGAKLQDDPVLLADLSEAIIGRERMGDSETAAVAVLRREGQIAQANPFAPDGAGMDLHGELASTALARVLAAPLPVERPAAERAAAAAPGIAAARAPGPLPAPALAPGPAPSPAPAGAGGGPEAGFMNRVARQESSGDDTAKNPRSSATGRYQFIDSTWLLYYKKRFGAGGLSDRQILAKRGDGRIQDQLMADLTGDNAAYLRRGGHAVTQGNLYLAHFAGPAGASRVLAADPSAPATRLFTPGQISANPFLRNMTARDVVAWAHRAMGQAPIAPGTRVRIGEGMEGALARNEAERDSIQAALDDAQARAAALSEEARTASAQMDDDLVGARPDPLDWNEADLGEIAAFAPRADAAADAPPEADELLPKLRAIARDTSRSLNAVDGLAEELGVTPDIVRRGLDQLVGEGHITRRRDNGNYMRKPPGWNTGPDDLVRFLARIGGLSYDRLGPKARALGWLGDDLKNQGRLRTFVPGVGPLLRPRGRGVDDAAEQAWEAGYFGPPEITPRPTEVELIDAIEQQLLSGRKRYSVYEGRGAEEELPEEPPREPGQNRPRPANGAPDPDRDWTPEERMQSFREAWEYYGGDPAKFPDDPQTAEGAAIYWTDGDAFMPEHAVWQVADELYRLALGRIVDEGMERDYGPHYDIFDPRIGEEREQRFLAGLAGRPGADETSFDGSAPDPGNPGGGGARGPFAGSGGEAADEGFRLAELTPEERAPFLDPDGAAIKAQADSLEHDARAAVDGVDPNIAERQRQEAQMGAEAPLRTMTPQDSTLGFGLFGEADGVRLDPEGEARPVKDLLDEFDAEAAELKAIRDCL